MSVLSLSCCSFLSAVCAFALVSAGGCGTDARGVDDCRDIEEARCSAAKGCKLVADGEVDACKRFYRDQCLHGLSGALPGSVQVKECVATIVAAGSCATALGSDAELVACDPAVGDAPGVRAVCDIVKEPERASACAFLAPRADAGSGGSGAGEPTGGSSGEAGSAGESGS